MRHFLRSLTGRKASKRCEATTDESQLSATSSWRQTLRRFRMQCNDGEETMKRLQQSQELCRDSFRDDQMTNDDGDLLQAIASNSCTLPPTVANASSSSRYKKQSSTGRTAISSSQHRDDAESRNSHAIQAWHNIRASANQSDNFLPTAYPLARSDPRSRQSSRWGNLNLAASAALIQEPLKRFELAAQRKRPRFRLGPRAGSTTSDEAASKDRSSTLSSTSGAAVDVYTPKYAFISQDGKLVEREILNWPRRKHRNACQRYKLDEPYASRYGKRSAKRAMELSMQPVQLRDRCIYERPIHLMPRTLVMENKRRLMTRHKMKGHHETSGPFVLPATINLLEVEQAKQCCVHQQRRYVEQARQMCDFMDKVKQKKKGTTQTNQQQQQPQKEQPQEDARTE